MSNGDRLIQDYVEGHYRSVDTGELLTSPIKAISIVTSTEGQEADLIQAGDLGASPVIVSDQNTHDVLGQRLERALGIPSIVLDRPKANEQHVQYLLHKARHATSLIAVGSGTINDLCKYAGHLSDRPSLVFATAPSMNGYTTKTASIDRDGFKLSLKAIAPSAVIYDLAVLAAAPKRLIRSGVGDAICRGTAQVDWLISHHLLDTPYFETPFDLQRVDEAAFLDSAPRILDGDLDAMAALVRILTLGGLGSTCVGTSHPGSMGEHSISHYIDMFADPHPGSHHGEQVGIATLTMARLHALMLRQDRFSAIGPLPVDEPGMQRRYGDKTATCIEALTAKTQMTAAAGELKQRLDTHWPQLRPALARLMIDPARIEAIFSGIGAACRPEDIGLDPAFYRETVMHSFEIRDRYGMLDLAVQTGEMDRLVDEVLA